MSHCINHLKIIAGLAVFGFLNTSCERIYEEPKENIDEAIEFASAFRGPLCLYESVENISSVLLETGLVDSNVQILESQMGVEINIIDSNFADDDSMIFQVDFLGDTKHSFDTRKRSGKLKMVVYKDYFELGSMVKTFISKTVPFEIELSDGSVIKLMGNLNIIRQDPTLKIFEIDSLTLRKKNPNKKDMLDDDWKLKGLITVETKINGLTVGLSGDEIKYTGNGSWELNNQSSFLWDISVPLEMRFEFGCSDYLNKGIIKLNKGDNRYFLNFDPFGTGACNRIVNITKAGKEFEVTLP